MSAARRVGVTFRSVSPGVAAYPVTTAGGSGVQRGRDEAVGESTYTIAVTEMKPSRNAVHGIYSIEDDMRIPACLMQSSGICGRRLWMQSTRRFS